MSKHTPGPWGVWNYGNLIITDNKHARWLAIIQPDFCGAEANATLIAAAPELLEALKAICDAVDGKLTREEEMAVPDKARAAIAKATGQEV